MIPFLLINGAPGIKRVCFSQSTRLLKWRLTPTRMSCVLQWEELRRATTHRDCRQTKIFLLSGYQVVPSNRSLIDVLRSNPIFLRKDTSHPDFRLKLQLWPSFSVSTSLTSLRPEHFQWRIRNLPYPADVYSVLVIGSWIFVIWKNLQLMVFQEL